MGAGIEQTCVPGEGHTWRWTLSLRSDGQRHRVARVIYRLHPGLATPVKAASDPNTGFAVRFTAWGGFTVVARVVFDDGTEERLTADLCLPDGALPPEIDVPEKDTAAGYFALARRFQGQGAFRQARRAYAKARERLTKEPEQPALAAAIDEQEAVSTYKDATLPEEERLDDALALLGGQQGLREAKSSERLGIAGAIFKRMWELSGQRASLAAALLYYGRGREIAGRAAEFDGYTSINAAYLLDVLAYEEEKEAAAAGASGSNPRRGEARELREEILRRLGPRLGTGPWWVRATVAEAFLGLGRLDEMRAVMRESMALPDVIAWHKESTAMQMAGIIRYARWPEDQRMRAWMVFDELFGAGARFRATLGKVGLALSGGGFRASLFHIGVLARLAELDLLRHVEVMSCVSGGSIVGTHYYLLLRELLQRRSDGPSIDRPAYVEVVKKLIEQFMNGIAKNIRTRVVLDPFRNLRMIVDGRRYSRTNRLAELYEKHLFSQVDDGERGRPRFINDLFIQPRDNDGHLEDGFSPRLSNWMRSAKVPVLVLNAATLNTGHGWQFTASWMGEPPIDSDGGFDANDRLRRVYYEDADNYHRMSLGQAVAASSCVPGLFDPLPLPGLYPNRTVRLIDGGTRDNQGVESLFDQDCRLFVISDASGQMDSQADPGRGILKVLLRSKSLLETQVRTGQYRDLQAHYREGTLRRPTVVHLKQGLDVEDVSWIGTNGGTASVPPVEAQPAGKPQGTTMKAAQRKVAAIRTDLDSFTEIEAFALMTSGYRLMEQELGRADSPFSEVADHSKRESWAFLEIEPAMRDDAMATPAGRKVQRQLQVAANVAFKVFSLLVPLKVAMAALALAAIVGLGVPAIRAHWGAPLLRPPTVGWAVDTLAVLALGGLVAAVLGRFWGRVVRFNQTIREVVLAVVASVLLSIVAALHLLLFDRLFKWQGQLSRLAIGSASSVGSAVRQDSGELATTDRPDG